MKSLPWKQAGLAIVTLACMLLSTANALAEPIRVLIVTGQHSHDWQESSAMMQKILQAQPGIEADVTRTPEKGAPRNGLGRLASGIQQVPVHHCGLQPTALAGTGEPRV